MKKLFFALALISIFLASFKIGTPAKSNSKISDQTSAFYTPPADEVYGTYPVGTVCTSAGGHAFHLDYQSDGNLVLYPAGHAAIWASRTVLPAGTNAGTCTVSCTGQMILKDSNGNTYWTGGQLWGSCAVLPPDPGCKYILQEDGNFVEYQYNLPSGTVENSVSTRTAGGGNSPSSGRLQ